MRLLIVSHTPHYRDGDRLVGWGATVREIDFLASLFTSVIHVAPVHALSAPPSFRPYEAPHVKIHEVVPAGGDDLSSKLGILRQIPAYLRVIHQELSRADVVHVRCPANLSLLAIVLLAFRRHPRARWIKYAGNWRPEGREPWSYRLQRWWLRRPWHGAIVTVNGRWPGSPEHIRSFLNPSFSRQEFECIRSTAQAKGLGKPVRIIFVGRLETEKGAGRALQILSLLNGPETPYHLDLVGDGPERRAFESMAESLGVQSQTVFHGWLSRSDLNSLYARSHFILLPSNSEGWPKVLSEAMAHGAVPISSNVSCIPQLLESFDTGDALPPEDIEGFRKAIARLANDPSEWRRQSLNAVQAAAEFTYEAHLERVRDLLLSGYGLELGGRRISDYRELRAAIDG